MLLNNAAECAKFCIQNNLPVMFVGEPGTGKTDRMRQLADECGLAFLPESFATYESVDLRGLPATHNGVVAWSRPDFMDRVLQLKASTGKNVLLFIDEVNTTDRSLEAPLMQLTLTGQIGPHKLPEGTQLAFAGNNTTDGAAARQMGTAFWNRVSRFDIDPPNSPEAVREWCKWAAANNIHPMLIAFMMLRGASNGTVGTPGYNPGMLHCFDPKSKETAQRTSRSWAISSPFCDAPDHLMYELFRSRVGHIGAVEITGFAKVYRSAPPILKIVSDPVNTPVPAEPGVKYAVTLALSRAATMTNLSAILTYIKRVGAEYEGAFITDAIRRNADLTDTPAFINWTAANPDFAA